MNILDQALAGASDPFGLDDGSLMTYTGYYPAGLGWSFPNPFKAISKGVKAVTNKVKQVASKAVDVVKKVAPAAIGVATKVAMEAANGYINGGIQGAIRGGTAAVKSQITAVKSQLANNVKKIGIAPNKAIAAAINRAGSNLAKVATNPKVVQVVRTSQAQGMPVSKIANEMKQSNAITAATALTTAQVARPIIEQALIQKGMSAKGAAQVAKEAAPAVAIDAAEKATGKGFNPVMLAPLALLAL